MEKELLRLLAMVLNQVPQADQPGNALDLNQYGVGKNVIIRTYTAGVHFGELVQRNGTEVLLKNARRIWKWSGAFTLTEVAALGIDTSQSRLSIASSEPILLTQAIEVILCSIVVIKQLTEAKSHDC